MRFVFFLAVFVAGVSAQHDAHFRNGNVIVHLFEWPWSDIAEECERFLGPYGFGGVQVSPANEHIEGTQWWTRYQPVSYQLNSRSGSEWEFKNMVERCNAVNVNIYVDVVINHMAAWSYEFPGVPYGIYDFNVPCNRCPSYNSEINNYYEINEVRNCNLVGLNDLYMGSEYVRGKIVEFLNEYVSCGVAGFRVDAAKHMWPGDLRNIVGRLKSVPWSGKPYIYQEVIDMGGGEPIKAEHYIDIGDVTEFKHSVNISKVGWCSNNLACYNKDFEKGLLPGNRAVVFVDNHDNQRNHGGGGNIVTHKDPASYKRAVAFMLAWNYGTKRIMSSYAFSNSDQGPPKGKIPINSDGTCGGGWMCEHRWRQIRNMVTFSKVAGSESVQHWWDNGYNQIAFSRGNKGFFTMTCEGQFSRDFFTGLPDGDYCDVISGDPNGYGGCTGTTVRVSGGYALITVPSGEDSMVAIHVEAKVDNGGNPVTQPTGGDHTSPSGYARTVIFIYKETSMGQDVFIRGGIDHSRRFGCTEDADSSPCAIPIIHNTGGTDTRLNELRKGDDYLDWYGSESDQISDAFGTPLVWTTNDKYHESSCDNEGYGYTPMNTWGAHYWMLDVDMDCSKTEDGWFEFKGFVQGAEGWESDRQQGTCEGAAGGKAPYVSNNHLARCGFVNKFTFDDNSCDINPC